MAEGKKIKEQLKKAKEDLEDMEIYIADLTSFLPVAFCLVSGIGKVVDINNSFNELTGFSLIESAGRFIKSFFLEKKEIDGLLEEVSKKNVVKTKEFTLLSKRKKEIPASVSISARRDKDKNLIGYFFAINNITEFKELQESLEKKVKERTKQLQQRINELEKFRRLTEKREIRMIELKKTIEQMEKK